MRGFLKAAVVLAILGGAGCQALNDGTSDTGRTSRSGARSPAEQIVQLPAGSGTGGAGNEGLGDPVAGGSGPQASQDAASAQQLVWTRTLLGSGIGR